jgi:ubiquinone biosynthesis protein
MTIASSRVKEEMVRNTDWKKEVRSWSWRFLRSAEKGVEIPSLLVDVLNNFQAGRSEVNLNLNSSDELSQVIFQAVRNLVIGMCVAALLISSSTICTTDMEPKILGIPALGVLGYVAALLIAMFFSLRHWHRKRKK